MDDLFAEMAQDALNPIIPSDDKLAGIAKLVQQQISQEKVVEAATALDEYDDYYVHAPAEIVLNKALEKALAALKEQT